MTVLQLISSREGFYGAEKMVLNLSLALRHLGINSVVAAFRNFAKDSELEVVRVAASHGLPTEIIECQGRFDRSAILQLRSVYRKHNIALVHSHNIKANLYARIAVRGQGIRTIGTCHTWHINSRKDWLVSVLDRLILRQFDAIVLVSEKLRGQVGRFGIRRSCVEVIENGIPVDTFLNAAPALRDELGLRGEPLVGTICRLAPEKGLRYLVQAVPSILDEFPNATFALVGDGRERPMLAALSESLGIQNRCRFLDVRDNVPEILSSIDVFVLSSLVEGAPLALIEAMSAAKAIVATTVGSVPQMIHHDRSGLLVPPADSAALAVAIKRLLREKGLAETLGLNARQKAEDAYSANLMAKRYADVYRRVAAA